MNAVAAKPLYRMGALECVLAAPCSADLRIGEYFPKDLEAYWQATNDLYLLFPRRVLGYATNEKVWGQFLVDGVEEPLDKNASIFEHVQLDPTYKTLIKSIFNWEERKSIDFRGDSASSEERSNDLDSSRDSTQSGVDLVKQRRGPVLLFHGTYEPSRITIWLTLF